MGEQGNGAVVPPSVNSEDWKTYTFAELRHGLGFGPRRLKLLLWLTQHPELEQGHWRFEGSVGQGTIGTVKMGLWQMVEVGST